MSVAAPQYLLSLICSDRTTHVIDIFTTWFRGFLACLESQHGKKRKEIADGSRVQLVCE